ncbi:hypothetical protein [Amycolatopsis minnesotensis]|uniref:Uncharacterized protein n=1 Tax=Amycolatopsis minnesotensis TaxID=337894 RepID=A0ABP5C804_9PSEU
MSFKKIFDSGESEGDSAEQSARALHDDTPGAGAFSEEVRKLESGRDPWLVRQTPHGAFDVMGFLGPLFQKVQTVSAAQRDISQDPASTSGMASSAVDKTFEKVKVEIRDEDLPSVHDARICVVVTDGVGESEGLAVAPGPNTAYVVDCHAHTLVAVDLTTGARRLAAKNLGHASDVALDGDGTAYVTDYDGARLLAVDLSNGEVRTVTSVQGADGVALDGNGKAYVSTWGHGQLVEVDLGSGQKNTVAEGLGDAAGVALDGNGKAYVGQRNNTLHEISLADGTKRVVATLPAGTKTIRVVLDGAGKAYTADPTGHRLHEIDLADGAHRVVAARRDPPAGAVTLDQPHGLALDRGWLYVSTKNGLLWRFSQHALQALGGVGGVLA